MQVFELENVFLASASRKYVKEAVKEIQGIDEKARVIDRFPDGVFTFCISPDGEGFLRKLASQSPVFLRHVHPVDRLVFFEKGENPPEAVARAVETLAQRIEPGRRVAVQARRIPGEYDYTLFSFKKEVDPVISEKAGAVPTVKKPDFIISIFISDSTGVEPDAGNICSIGQSGSNLKTWDGVAFVGISTPEENLCEWSGGAVRFAKEVTQVSRAEFKLLEALEIFPVGLNPGWNVLDLGSSPGGWVRVLAQKGCRVTAVDQAPLDPSVSKLPGVRFVKQNAYYYRGEPNNYDLLTNDINRDPIHSAKTAVNMSEFLKPEAPIIMTLKLPGKNPGKIVQKAMDTLDKSYLVESVRQLFHNRDEVTLFGRRKIPGT